MCTLVPTADGRGQFAPRRRLTMAGVCGAGLVSEPDGPQSPRVAGTSPSGPARPPTPAETGSCVPTAGWREKAWGRQGGCRIAEAPWAPQTTRPGGEGGRRAWWYAGSGNRGNRDPDTGGVSKMQLGTQRWSCWQGWGSHPQQCDPKRAHGEGSTQNLTRARLTRSTQRPRPSSPA